MTEIDFFEKLNAAKYRKLQLEMLFLEASKAYENFTRGRSEEMMPWEELSKVKKLANNMGEISDAIQREEDFIDELCSIERK